MRKVLAILSLCIFLPALAVDEEDLNRVLKELEEVLEQQPDYEKERKSHIANLRALAEIKPTPDRLLAIGEAYIGFDNDSAITYLSYGLSRSRGSDRYPFLWHLGAQLPLEGLFERAQQYYSQINPDSLPDPLLAQYYEAGRQMYSFTKAFFKDLPADAIHIQEKELQMQRKLLEVLPPNSLDYHFHLGEYYYIIRQYSRAQVILKKVLEDAAGNNRIMARTAYYLAMIAREAKDTTAEAYYFAVSAIHDVKSATREVASLQELGNHLYTTGDISRAHHYLASALENAVACGATLRMIQTVESLPIIERAYTNRLASSRDTLYFVVLIMCILIIVLLATLIFLRSEMRKMQQLQLKLRNANEAKEIYISEFLQLCTFYMDKLNQLGKLVARKLTAGRSEELLNMTKSGKFIEGQSREFYDVFDSAFLHIYPTFVEQVNALLKPEHRIEHRPGEPLNTELRMLAFMRLGIEESQRIAQVLNYSLNTIYAYRNRLKSKAISRNTFEDDIMKISSLS